MYRHETDFFHSLKFLYIQVCPCTFPLKGFSSPNNCALARAHDLFSRPYWTSVGKSTKNNIKPRPEFTLVTSFITSYARKKNPNPNPYEC